MYKEELRELFQEKREELSVKEIEGFSIRLAQQFFHYTDFTSVKSIHTFLPIEHKKEVNTWFIIDEIRIKYPDLKIIVSKADPQNDVLESFVLAKGTVLIKNKWNIPEPVDAATFCDTDIDMVLVPLLAFDLEGFRVGYGKGFYDKFFMQCRKDVLKVGLSFFDPVDMIIDIDKYDVPVDICITPDKVYDFRGS